MRTFRRYASLTILLCALSLLAIVTEEPLETVAVSGSGSPAPLNYNFESPSFDTGTPPTNHDFATGDLTGWTVVSGAVSIETREPGDYFASGDSLATTLETASFTVPDDAQTIRWQDIYLGGGNNTYDVDVIVGGNANRLASAVEGASYWKTETRNITEWQGQTIKLQFYLGENVGIDNAGVSRNVVPHWDLDTSIVPRLRSDGEHGQYVILPSSLEVYSSPIALTQRISYERRFLQPDTTNCLDSRLLNADDNSFIAHFATGDCGDRGDWERVDEDFSDLLLGNWNGGLVRFEFLAAGTVALDAGILSGTTDQLTQARETSADDGDPFDTSLGDLNHSHTDILVPGRGVPLEFSRHYHSQVGSSGPLGYGWSHTYDMALTFLPGGSISVKYDHGGTAHFEESGGAFVAPAGVHDELVDNGDGTYTLTTKAQIRYNFDSTGTLTSIEDRNDNTTSLTYLNGRLSSVTDPGGRSLDFTYEPTFDVINTPDPTDAF